MDVAAAAGEPVVAVGAALAVAEARVKCGCGVELPALCGALVSVGCVETAGGVMAGTAASDCIVCRGVQPASSFSSHPLVLLRRFFTPQPPRSKSGIVTSTMTMTMTTLEVRVRGGDACALALAACWAAGG